MKEVGQPLPHDSASRHVRGSANYVDDLPEPQGTVHVAPGAAEAACGLIRSLDLSAVRSFPGVLAVLEAGDIPGRNDCSPAAGDDPILAEDEVRFPGDVVFAVVAETRDIARRAAKRARIEVESTPPRVTVDDGLAADSDLLPPYGFERGDAAGAVAAAPHRLEGRLRIGGQDHFYLEGQVALAVPGEDDEIRVFSSTQHPAEVQGLVASMLDIPDAAVVCECRRMGGAFGGKESQAAQWACLAALAARKLGRPAKLRLDRDDDMAMTGKRHDFRADFRCGLDGSGALTGIEIDLAARCGCSLDLSTGVCDRATFHADNAYYYPAATIQTRRLRTDTVSNTAFRGFGGPQGMIVAERAMDAAAITLGLDPLLVRKRNLYRPGRDTTPYGMTVEEHVLPDIVETLEQTSDYAARREAVSRFNLQGGPLRKGIALTPVKFGIAYTLLPLNQAGALVHVFMDGSIQVNHGGTEMGQGLYIKVAQVVAEELGVDIDKVHITATRTDKVPNAPATAASSGSDLNGMAARLAAGKIRRRLAELAARRFGVEPDAISFANGRVGVAGGDDERPETISFAELAATAFQQRVSLSATGFFRTPKIGWNRDRRSGRPFLYFACGAACTEVTVDTETGEILLDRVDILHDTGNSLNPAIDIGQIEGGFVQGLGWLTTEELVFDPSGRLLTHAPSTYKIPTCSDVPYDFRVDLYESDGNPEPTIYRSKAVGEPPLMLALSVFSAITHAVASLAPGRVPPLDAPATPEAILRAADALRHEHRPAPALAVEAPVAG
ncbi:MAG: xanthine dehydrogenase molybdopterin binding subunit [Acidobacteria bacterium]|nr:xanthine dehydrogenase molybdopterin binding subunit [Acidobacteriota bacterium]